jgi:CheY-like chemotaxis protein
LRDHATKIRSGKPESPRGILLVEDHQDTAAVLSRALRRKGFRVSTANTVAAAVELFESEQFDLLISDIGLPDGSGIDLLTRMNLVRRIPAVALSGYGMERDLAKSLAAGFIEHLIKPVNLDALCKSIERALAEGN